MCNAPINVKWTPKTSKNIAWYLYSRGPVRQVCLLLTNQLAGFLTPIPSRFDIPSWTPVHVDGAFPHWRVNCFYCPPPPPPPQGVAIRYRDTYLKLKMCMLWSRGLSMSLAILHIYFKQLLEEQVKQYYYFLKWPDSRGATDLSEIFCSNYPAIIVWLSLSI